MEHYALVGNKTCGVSGMAAAASRKKNIHCGSVCGRLVGGDNAQARWLRVGRGEK